MNDSLDYADGFSAQGSNVSQKDNPFTKRAKDWDAGWRARKEMELTHRLEKDEIDDIPKLFIGWRVSLEQARKSHEETPSS